MSDGYRHYAGLKGSKYITVGADPNIFNYTSLDNALAASQANDVIWIENGTYSLSAATTINYNLTLIGRGRVTINGGDDGFATRLFMLNKPAAGTTATYMRFENIIFANNHESGDVFEIDNDGGGTGAMYVDFIGCSFSSGASGLAFDIDQTTATIAMFVNIIGFPGNSMDSCNFALTKAASAVNIEGYDLSDGAVFTLGAGDVASVYQWSNCIFGSDAITTGGAASVLQNFINCVNETGNIPRGLAYEDIDATGNVVIVGADGGSTPAALLVGPTGEGYAYTSIATAVAAADAGDVIYLEPGTHTIATDTTLTLNKNISIIGRGRCVVTGDVNDRMIMINKPTTGTDATYIRLENLKLINTDAGNGDVIEIDNDAGGTGALYLDFIDCSFDSNGGLSIDLDQTTATEHIYMTVKGYQSADMIMDSMNLALSLAGSEVKIDGYDFGASTITLGTDNVASIYSIINCQYESDAFTSGGAASVIWNAQGCAKVSSGAIVAPVIEDFDATTASENIQIGTLDT